MGKSLVTERTPDGMALFSNFADHVRNNFYMSKRQHGRGSVETVLRRDFLMQGLQTHLISKKI